MKTQEGEMKFNCKKKAIPKKCTENILDRKHPYYLQPEKWCVGCRYELPDNEERKRK